MEPVTKPEYWSDRLKEAIDKKHLHYAVFIENEDRWKAIEEKHRQILAKHIKPTDVILDAGCGYGRLLNLLPHKPEIGNYWGVDISPQLLSLANMYHPGHIFQEESLTDLYELRKYEAGMLVPRFDWGILISVRPMLIRNMGREYWDKCEKELRAVCKKLLFLEYDPKDEGSIE